MNVFMVEDHPIVVSAGRQLFAEQEDVVFTHAPTIADARRYLEGRLPDVMVIDVNLPDGSGIDFVRELRAAGIQPNIVVFSMYDDPTLAMTAIDYGAKGFVSKSGSPDELLDAVEAVRRGEAWLSEDLLQQIAWARAMSGDQGPRLTRREKNVLGLLISGRHINEIAADLNISPKLVSGDCAAIREKLNARTTAEMVAIAVKAGIAS